MRNKIVLFDIDYTLFDTGTFKGSGLKTYRLYDETEEVLKKLSEFSEIGIFSQGDDSFQREKLKQTLIDARFKEKNIHVFIDKDDNLGNILKKYKGYEIFLVDDKLGVLRLAKDMRRDVFVIWVKRGPFAENQKEIEGFSPDATVSDLSEIMSIILNTKIL